MSRRRQRPAGPPPNPFQAAFDQIDTLEEAVIARTVETPFDMDDVAAWMWPVHVRDKLKTAFPVAAQPYRNHYDDVLTLPDLICTVRLDLDDAKMCCPRKGLTEINLLDDVGPIPRALIAGNTVFRQFEKVREVVTWLGENATPGAARYYWPTILSLLPAAHVCNEADGLRYKEPGGVARMIPLMRETSGIVAGALMCDLSARATKSRFMVQFQSQEDDTRVSRQFGLL